MLKTVVLVLAAVVIAVLAWDHFKAPTLDGPVVPEQERVLILRSTDTVSIADLLQKKRWTLILFTAPSTTDSDALERRLEATMRQRVNNVRLVIIDVGGLDSQAARALGLKELPSAWLFEGYSKRRDDLDYILKLVGA